MSILFFVRGNEQKIIYPSRIYIVTGKKQVATIKKHQLEIINPNNQINLKQ